MILCFRLSTDISSIACFDKVVVDKDLLIWSKPLVLIDASGLVDAFSLGHFSKKFLSVEAGLGFVLTCLTEASVLVGFAILELLQL